jgi:hypothetical protein
MKNKYPKIGGKSDRKPQGRCKLCGKNKADCRVDVEFNEFRGDDIVYKCHKECADKAGDRLLFLLTQPSDGSIACQVCFATTNAKGLPFTHRSIITHERNVHGIKERNNQRIVRCNEDIADGALQSLTGLYGDIF